MAIKRCVKFVILHIAKYATELNLWNLSTFKKHIAKHLMHLTAWKFCCQVFTDRWFRCEPSPRKVIARILFSQQLVATSLLRYFGNWEIVCTVWINSRPFLTTLIFPLPASESHEFLLSWVLEVYQVFSLLPNISVLWSVLRSRFPETNLNSAKFWAAVQTNSSKLKIIPRWMRGDSAPE